MRFTLAAAATLVAGAAAGYNNPYSNSSATASYYVTKVVSSYETYCSEATTVTYNGYTYSMSEPGYLTITNCPCTVTQPVYSAVVTSSTPCETSTPVYTPAPYNNATTCVTSSYPVGTGTPVTSAYATFTGAANKAFAASGAGLVALVGAAAALLYATRSGSACRRPSGKRWAGF